MPSTDNSSLAQRLLLSAGVLLLVACLVLSLAAAALALLLAS